MIHLRSELIEARKLLQSWKDVATEAIEARNTAID